MQTLNIFNPISLDDSNEESYKMVYGFEDYTDPDSDFLSLSFEDKEPIPNKTSKQYYSVPFRKEFDEEEYLKKKGDFKHNLELSAEVTLRHTQEEFEDGNSAVKNVNKIGEFIPSLKISSSKEKFILSQQDLKTNPLKISNIKKNALSGTKQRGQRRRKRITMKRNAYKERKDVLLKSILRKFRKFFSESFSNFNRIKFLKSSETAIFDNPDIFPTEFEAGNPLQLSLESLQEFTRSGNCSDETNENLAMFIGCLISPRDFKKQLENNHIPLDTSEERKRLTDICDLVHEVLYKFSYHKLSLFINITEFGTLFKHFDKMYI